MVVAPMRGRCVLMILPTAQEAVLDKSARITQGHFRDLLRQIPRPVVIATSVDFPMTPAEEKYDAENWASSNWASSTAESDQLQRSDHPALRAMTVSSFTSVALQPRRLISFNIQRPSRCYDAIRRSGRFNIHVLRANPSGARLAKYFSQPLPPGKLVAQGFNAPHLYGNTGAQIKGNWNDIWFKMRASPTIPDSPERTQKPMGEPDCVPILRSDGVLYVLRCVLAQCDGAGSGLIDADQASILIGEVLDAKISNDQEYSPQESSLVYATQRYQALGESFPTPEKIEDPDNVRRTEALREGP